MITEPWPGSVGLLGEHQRWNAALAAQSVAAAAELHGFLKVSSRALDEALASTTWPGRFQLATDRIILDGAHNPAGAQALVNTWQASFGEDRATIILGMMRDKDFGGVIRKLLPIAARVFTVAVDNPRALSPQNLAAEVRSAEPPCTGSGFQLARCRTPCLLSAKRRGSSLPVRSSSSVLRLLSLGWRRPRESGPISRSVDQPRIARKGFRHIRCTIGTRPNDEGVGTCLARDCLRLRR
jgi:hypothetical protein